MVSVSPLKLQPLLPQVWLGGHRISFGMSDPWLPKAQIGRQVAVLRGTAYATPGERAIIALRGKPQPTSAQAIFVWFSSLAGENKCFEDA